MTTIINETTKCKVIDVNDVTISKTQYENNKSISGIHDSKSDDKTDLFQGYTQMILSSEKNKNNIISSYTNISPSKLKKNNDIIFLNFEDDTFKPVIKMNNEMMNIINKWYDKFNLIVDIEETEIEIPNNILEQDLSKILFKNVNCKYRDIYLNEYIPEILNSIKIQQNIKKIEKIIKPFGYQDDVIVEKIKKNINLEDLKIIIPENIVYNDTYFYKEKNNIHYLPNKNNQNTKPESKENHLPPGFKRLPFGSINQNQELSFKHISEHIFTYNSCSIISDDKYSCYNAEYNILKPPFGANSLLIEETNNYKTIHHNTKLVIVILNPIFLQTNVIIDPDLNMLNIILEHQEYGFIELFTISTTNDDIITSIQKQYDNVIFNDIDEININLKETSHYLEFIKNKQHKANPVSDEENTVKTYLNIKFNISDNINDKMKASVLHDLIIQSNVCSIEKTKITGFKNRLSQYLKDIGLKKKRYNDGYYYYGIVKKTNVPISTNNYTGVSLQDLFKKTIEKRYIEAEMYNKIHKC